MVSFAVHNRAPTRSATSNRIAAGGATVWKLSLATSWSCDSMASMSTVVPLVSDLVTGIAAPAIAAAATWTVSSRQAAAARRADQVTVMDAAAQAAAAARTHLGHLYALWRQDIAYDSHEASTTFEKSQLAMEAVRYARSRIGTRFGPASPAATTYDELVHGFRAVAYGRRHYRQGVEYADVAAELEPQMLRLDALQRAFLEAAHPQLHGKRGSPR